MNHAMIRFEQVSKSYDQTRVVDQLSLSIDKGEFVTILGASGSGKTTLLKMINRLVEPTSGRILVDEQVIDQVDVIELRRRIGYVVQEIGLFPHQTVAENIATVPRLLGWDKHETAQRIEEMLELVQLPKAKYASRYPHQLSGGQQQRVGVARALAANPDIVLFDEPFGAIDAITRTELQDALLKIHQELGNKTFVLITHDVHEAFKLGNRVLIMDQGKMAQFDSPKAIVASPQPGFVQQLLHAAKEQLSVWGELDG